MSNVQISFDFDYDEDQDAIRELMNARTWHGILIDICGILVQTQKYPPKEWMKSDEFQQFISELRDIIGNIEDLYD